MITIDGLNKKQVAMLDKLWSIDRSEQLNKYLATLSTEDVRIAQTLIEMIILEQIDEDTKDQTRFPDVENLLEKIMKKG
jgi:hypothetical protein